MGPILPTRIRWQELLWEWSEEYASRCRLDLKGCRYSHTYGIKAWLEEGWSWTVKKLPADVMYGIYTTEGTNTNSN